MKNKLYCRVLSDSSYIAAIVLLFCFTNASHANPTKQVFTDSAEKKADYLQRIYFSGENKEGLNRDILIALQEMQALAPTVALGQQVTFLLDIQDDAAVAKNACDILDLLAVGIYNMDAAEAKRMGVNIPSENAKKKTINALESLNTLRNTTDKLGSTASAASWNSFLLSGGKYSGFASEAGKLAGTMGKASVIAGSASQVAGAAKEMIDLGKSMGISFKKKDNACKEVPLKEVAITQRQPISAVVAAAPLAQPAQQNAIATPSGTTTIGITNISYDDLKIITGLLKDRKSVHSATQSFNEKKSTIAVVHTGACDELTDWMITNFGTKFKLISSGENKIELIAKK